METNILAEEKPKSIKLADGKEYTLPPIDLTTLANIQKTMGFKLRELASKIEDDALEVLRLLTYALLKENHPELTLDGVGHLITLKEIKDLTETISIIMAISS